MTLSLPKLKKLGHGKGIPKMPSLGKKKRVEEMPDIDTAVQGATNLLSDEEQRLANALGDQQLAKRVLKLKETYPDATFPELVTIDWLERRKKKWGFQVWAMGGRAIKGGQVLDLIVDAGAHIVVIEVQGNYWHNRPGQKRVDAAQRLVLMGIKIWGKPVRAVVEVWESKIMSKKTRDHALNQALLGIEVGE